MATQQKIVEGYVYWLDEKGVKIPLRSAIVDLYGYTFMKYENLTLEDFLTTDQRGYFKGTLPAYQVVYPNYSWLNIHTKELADENYTKKAEALRTNASSSKKSRELIIANSKPEQLYSYTDKLEETKNPILAEISFKANDGAFSVFDALFVGQKYATTIAGLSPEEAIVKVNFIEGGISEYNRPTQTLHISKADSYNWDIILHEYGHHIANIKGIQGDSVWGKHDIFENSIIKLQRKEQGTRKAWSEGLATYLGIAAQKFFEKQNSTSLPTDLGFSLLPDIAQNTSYNLPMSGNFVDLENSISSGNVLKYYPGSGEGDEISIARILWDLADDDKDYKDGEKDPFRTGLKDEVSLGHKGLFDTLQEVGSPKKPLERLDDLWDYFVTKFSSSPQELAKYGAIFEEYGVSPSPISEWLDSLPGPLKFPVKRYDAPKTFKWRVGNLFTDVGVIFNSTTRNNEFQIHVYNTAFQEVLTSPLLNDGNKKGAWTLKNTIWTLNESTNQDGEWTGEWTPEAGSEQERSWNDIVSKPGTYYVVITGSDQESIFDLDFSSPDTGAYWSGAHSFTVIDSGNNPPTLARAIAQQSAIVGQAFNFIIPVDTFSDPDAGDSLSYTATLENDQPLPDWLQFDSSTRTFSGTPVNRDVENFNIKVTATDGSQASISNIFQLAIAPQTSVLPALQWNADNSSFSINGNVSNLQITLNQRNTNFLNEMGLFQVDDEQGTIDGIVPNAPGYLEAALERSQVIFSALNNLPNGFTTTPSRTLTLNPDSHFRFYLVQNSTTDAVLKGQTSRDRVLISSPSSVQVSKSGESEYSVAWEDGSGNQDFADLVVKAQLTDQPTPLGTTLQGKPESEVLDFRNLTGSQIKAEFTVNREAAFNNYVGFYRISDSEGSITDPVTGMTLTPGQAGYIQAAVQNRVAGIDLAVANQGTAVTSGVFEGGSIFAPFIIVNGQLDQLLDTDASNNPAVYFPFLGANSDSLDHIRLLGDNLFGFEDLANGGDFDYNDITVNMNLTLV